jgi:ATP-dependent Clp protease ATP-binding subunit ClpC
MSERIAMVFWRDLQANVHGAILGDPEFATAIGATQLEVKTELLELANWLYEHQGYRLETNIDSVQAVNFTVQAHPRFRDGQRAQLLKSVELRIPCLKIVDEFGGKQCVQPHLQIYMSYEHDGDYKESMGHFLQEALREQSPSQLHEGLPPSEYQIDFGHISVRERSAQVPPERWPELQTLFQAAEPLLRDRKALGGALGRAEQVEDLRKRLSVARGNILLLGARSVGKTTLLVDAVRKLNRLSDEPSSERERALRKYRFWRIGGARFIAGMRYLGQWEARAEKLVDQLAGIQGVMAVERLVDLLRIGGAQVQSSVAAFLLPYLQRGELRMVAEATHEEYALIQRQFPALLDRFEVMPVHAFNAGDAKAVLREISDSIGSSQGTHAALASNSGLATTAPELIYRLFERFLPQTQVPGEPVRFLRKLAQSAKQKRIGEAEIELAFAQHTGLGLNLIRDRVALTFAQVRDALAQSVIGQTLALDAAAQVVINLKAGLNDPQRPIASLFFTGPTGTGKTALAKTLARYLFGNERTPDEASGAHSTSLDSEPRLIRLDLSEYQSVDAVDRLLSASDGQPARWLQQIEQQPCSVVLFDEIEKASSEVFDALLGLLDEGRITDRSGRRYDFRAAILILTSNLGASRTAGPGFQPQAPSAQHAVADHFRPEFFNRLDQIVAFRALTEIDMEAITRKELADLAGRDGIAERGLTLTFEATLVHALAKAGFDARYGARNLQRTVEKHVVAPLARWLLANPSAQDCNLEINGTLDCLSFAAAGTSISTQLV